LQNKMGGPPRSLYFAIRYQLRTERMKARRLKLESPRFHLFGRYTFQPVLVASPVLELLLELLPLVLLMALEFFAFVLPKPSPVVVIAVNPALCVQAVSEVAALVALMALEVLPPLAPVAILSAAELAVVAWATIIRFVKALCLRCRPCSKQEHAGGYYRTRCALQCIDVELHDRSLLCFLNEMMLPKIQQLKEPAGRVCGFFLSQVCKHHSENGSGRKKARQPD
jgi:hypothetical protein